MLANHLRDNAGRLQLRFTAPTRRHHCLAARQSVERRDRKAAPILAIPPLADSLPTPSRQMAQRRTSKRPPKLRKRQQIALSAVTKKRLPTPGAIGAVRPGKQLRAMANPQHAEFRAGHKWP